MLTNVAPHRQPLGSFHRRPGFPLRHGLCIFLLNVGWTDAARTAGIHHAFSIQALARPQTDAAMLSTTPRRTASVQMLRT